VKENFRRVGQVVAFALFVLVLAVGAVWILNQLDSGSDERERQAAEITGLQAGMDEANARLEALGVPPVPEPSTGAGPDDTPVVTVPPSQEQIMSAFEVWCDLRTCHGADGEDAPPMTRQQVLAGFTAWCSSSTLCVGKDGKDGDAGTPGRPPTFDEILAVVEVVCADGACDGKDGKDGTNGKDGRSIADVECHATGDWIFTFTDGTAVTVEGPCRAVEPTPTPTPTASATTK
jgi:hypothetical protein